MTHIVSYLAQSPETESFGMLGIWPGKAISRTIAMIMYLWNTYRRGYLNRGAGPEMSVYQAKNKVNPTFRIDVYVKKEDFYLIQSLANENRQSVSSYVRSRILRGKH